MVRRRTYLTRPGEGLLVAESAFDLLEKSAQFASDLSFDLTDLIISVTCGVPLPDYDLREGMRWHGINPDMLWHPLLWLPPELVSRRLIPLDGSPEEEFHEEDETLATRIALVCMASGLYDPQDGTWVDVLSMYGIDLDDINDYERVVRWLNGGGDLDLDAIDLREFTDPVDEANQLGLDVAVATEDAGVFVVARESIAMIEELFDPTEDISEEEQRATLALLVDVLQAILPERLIKELAPYKTVSLDVDVPAEDAAQEFAEKMLSIASEHADGADAFSDMFSA